MVASHATKIEQMQSAMDALQATVARLEGLPPPDASSDIVEMREQICSYSDAMTASEDRLISMMSPLIDETHETAERITELDLLVRSVTATV